MLERTDIESQQKALKDLESMSGGSDSPSDSSSTTSSSSPSSSASSPSSSPTSSTKPKNKSVSIIMENESRDPGEGDLTTAVGVMGHSSILSDDYRWVFYETDQGQKAGCNTQQPIVFKGPVF